MAGCDFPYSVAESTAGDGGADAADDAPLDAVASDAPPRDATPQDAPDAPLAEAAVDATAPCSESGAKLSKGHCYFALSAASPWASAAAACAAAGAHLATVANAEEQSVVAAAAVASGKDHWIGLSRKAGTPVAKTSFAWVTGEPLSYDAWAPMDPNVPSTAGACARVRIDGLWWDLECTMAHGAICERDP
jgi:hypothetical protein